MVDAVKSNTAENDTRKKSSLDCYGNVLKLQSFVYTVGSIIFVFQQVELIINAWTSGLADTCY